MAVTLASDGAELSAAIVTFNRMLRRLLDMLKEVDLCVRTMHSFVWHDYWSRMNRQPPHQPHDPYSYDWSSMFSCLEEVEEHPNRSHLVVDEGQDLPRGFFKYASRYVSRTITVFADENQALSERHTTLEQIKTASGLGNPIILNHNHRNTPEIARLAEHFHTGRLPAATVVRSSLKELPRLVRSGSLQSTAELISNWCNTRGGNIGVIVDRNDTTGRTLHGNLKRRLPKKRVDIYNGEDRNEDSIEMFEPGVTILNKNSVKGQEFEAVFILDLEAFIPCTNDAERRAMYMMCTRARDHLFLVHGPLSARAKAALPDASVLERA